MLALPIFPARLQASIFGVNELNFRVRNGNGWTLVTINTNYSASAPSKPNKVTLVESQAPAFLYSLNLLVKVKPSAY